LKKLSSQTAIIEIDKVLKNQMNILETV